MSNRSGPTLLVLQVPQHHLAVERGRRRQRRWRNRLEAGDRTCSVRASSSAGPADRAACRACDSQAGELALVEAEYGWRRSERLRTCSWKIASNSRLSAASPGPDGAWADARPAGMIGSSAATLPSERNSRRSIVPPIRNSGADDRPGRKLGKDARRKASAVRQLPEAAIAKSPLLAGRRPRVPWSIARLVKGFGERDRARLNGNSASA